MVWFIDAHRAEYGVEPIGAVLPIAPSTYHRHRRQQVDPTRRSKRGAAAGSSLVRNLRPSADRTSPCSLQIVCVLAISAESIASVLSADVNRR
jgi:hypothetical protein